MVSDLVSIIMPTYNVEKIVEDTIISVIKQSYTKWELLIVDDCSTDNTPSILNKMKLTDSRIKCFFLDENVGAGNSRNTGINNACGQYIAFLDSDDIWMTNKLMSQLEHMRNKNSPISHTSFSFIDELGNPSSGSVRVSDVVDLESNLRSTEIGTSTAIIDRSIMVDDIIFSSQRARQDLKLWISLLGAGYYSHGLDENLVKYRVRSGSVSSNKFKMLYITFKVYMGVSQLSLWKRVILYFSYVFNAIKKRT